MRIATSILALCLASASTVVAQSSFQMEHPGDTALSLISPGVYEYRSFPSLMRMYVYDGDSPGKSNCNVGCSSAWIPVQVSDQEVKGRVGDWTIIRRSDGSRQWAYKDRPAYTRFHDIDLDEATERRGFHLLTP